MRALASGLCALGLLLPGALTAQTVTVVNMIPATLSNETNQDSEPDITVSPLDSDLIVASAFTPNPTGATNLAPVYISQDGGNTWWLNNIVPSANGMTGDITVALSRNDVLYAGILRGGGYLDMRILRDNTYLAAGAMTELLARTSEDQPYARSYAPMGGAQRNRDQLYVGHNDFNNSPQTASFEQSLDAATAPAPAGLSTIRLERRTPWGQDGPPIRQAIHPDGTVYAVYTQRTASSGSIRTGNVVVVRDDDWGQGATPYDDLTDPGDTLPGRFVVSGVDWVWNSGSVFGQERLGDRLGIAVDPADSETVYVAWADRPTGVTGNTATLHVRRSTDGGTTWSADLLTIAGAISPQLAVSIRGDVGFLYQQLTGTAPSQRWESHFQQSTNGGTTWTDFTLADTPASSPAWTFLPYIGDYAGLTAVGKDFFGVFSANNTPDNANFPNGVTYQRSANFATNTLDDGSGNPVAVSIDPFFFHVENLAEDEDFYVRDWTDSATVNDTGVEPSTDPWFYTDSDVWNRRSNAPGGFNASDQPISEDPQPTTLGDNYAFARVHRKATSSAETVTLHFLKSEFGTGSNYQDAGTNPDPTLSFAAPDQVKTMTAGYQWPLLATSSVHTCLAVEISTPNDPVASPGLLGRAPGWPGTDLLVIYDNNKAQRNMGVYDVPEGESGSVTYWAAVHNAATYSRAMTLEVGPDERYAGLFDQPRVTVQGGKHVYEGKRLELPAMTPGENRWIGVTVPATTGLRPGEQVGVAFNELVDGLAVNGFTIAVRRAPFIVAAAESLRLTAANLVRLGHFVDTEKEVEVIRDAWPGIEKRNVSEDGFVKVVRAIHTRYGEALKDLPPPHQVDAFGLTEKVSYLGETLGGVSPTAVLMALADLNQTVDAYLTYLAKGRGDLADVAQNMRWQATLVRTKEELLGLGGLEPLADLGDRFDLGYATRKLSVKDYPDFVRRSLPLMQRIDGELGLGQEEILSAISRSLGNPRRLQWAHRQFLLRLEDLR